MQISIYEEMTRLDEQFMEELIWDREHAVRVSKRNINQIVRRNISGAKSCRWLRIAGICCIVIALSIPACAAVATFLNTSMPINDSNKHLIGTEAQDNSYIIYKDGQYVDSAGNSVDMNALAETDEILKKNRIVTEIRQPNFTHGSIVEIPQIEKSSNKSVFPELILVNSSICILTSDNGQGWELQSGDRLVYEFNKMDSQVVEEQNLVIGYVKDGVLHEGEGHREKKGIYALSIKESGTYYIYLLSASSDYLSLEQSHISVE